jgi:hypothetical protein
MRVVADFDLDVAEARSSFKRVFWPEEHLGQSGGAAGAE